MASNMPLIDIGTYTDTGQVRSRNEDSLQIYPQAHNGGQLFVVADGVGGENYGQEASQLAVRRIGVLYYQYYEQYPNQAIEITLKQVLTQVNTEIYTEALRLGSAGHMGTTAVVAVIRQRTLTVAWVGDSRIYVVSKTKLKARQITIDHSQVEDDVRAGILSREEAEHHPDRNVLSRSLGGNPQVAVDTITGELEERDLVILCSDGLTRYLNKDLIAEHVLYHPTSQKSAETLGEMANKAGGKDNISVVIVHLGERASEVETLMPAYNPPVSGTGHISAVNEPLPKPTRQNPKLVKTPQQSFLGNPKMVWGAIIGLVAIVILILLFVLSLSNRGVSNAEATEAKLASESLTLESLNAIDTQTAAPTATASETPISQDALTAAFLGGQQSIAETETAETATQMVIENAEILAANATASQIAAEAPPIPFVAPGDVDVGTTLYTQRETAVKDAVRPPRPSDRTIPANTRVVINLHGTENRFEFSGHYHIVSSSEGTSGWVSSSDLALNPPSRPSPTPVIPDANDSVSIDDSGSSDTLVNQVFTAGQTVYINATDIAGVVYLQPGPVVTILDKPITPGASVLIASADPQYQTLPDGSGQWWWQIELGDGTRGYIEANYLSATP